MMHSLLPGQLVFAKCGRDEGLPFIVVKVETDYVYLADGKHRKLENPKKKKVKHVQHTNKVFCDLKTDLGENMPTGEFSVNNKNLLNSHIRKAIKLYENVN